jgi:hypothetical protein
VCTESAGGQGANAPGSSVVTVPSESAALMTVGVTAGAEKLGSGGSAAATRTASSGGSGTATATGTGTGAATSSGGGKKSGAEGGFGERMWYAVVGMGFVAGVFNML